MSDVLSLSNRPDRYQWFIDIYGTHYPASIVYGGRADAMTRITRETQEDIDSVKRCLGGQVDTSAVITSQASGNICNQESYRLSQTLAKETTSWRGIGMTGGTEAAAAQCQSPRSLVPVYMELRPIDELLKSPLISVHGLEQAIQIMAIANGLANYINLYIDGQSQRLRSLMSDHSAKQGIDQGLQGCAAKDIPHRGGANVLIRLPRAPNGDEYRVVPFLPSHGDVQQLKIHARCDNFQWSTFEQHGFIERGNVPPCDNASNSAPCFRYQ
jgi:MAC/Perforin domain